MNEISQLNKDLINHAVAKCQQAISDIGMLGDFKTVMTGTTQTLFIAAIGAMLQYVPEDQRSQLLNQMFRELFHKIKAAAKDAENGKTS